MHRRLRVTLLTLCFCIALLAGCVPQQRAGKGQPPALAGLDGANPENAEGERQAAHRQNGPIAKAQPVTVPDVFHEPEDQAPAAPSGEQPTGENTYDMEGSVRRTLLANPQMQSIRAAFSGSVALRRQALANFGAVVTSSYTFTRQDGQANKTASQSLAAASSGASTSGTGNAASRAVHAQIGTWQNLYQIQLQVTQPLFTGFALLSAYQKASLAQDYNEANIRSTELSLVKSVQQAFLTLLQARANVQSNKDAVARLAGQYKLAQAYYDEGLYPRLDMLQAESDRAAAEQTLLKSQNTVLTQMTLLNSLLNLPLDQGTAYTGKLAYEPFPLSLEACLQTAYTQRPDLTMAVKSVQMAERDASIAASPLYPQVQAQGTVTRQGNRPDLMVMDKSGRTTPETRQYGLSASLQAFDGGSTYFGFRATREKVKKLQADLASLRLTIGTQVKTAYSNLEDAAKRIAVARVAVVASKEGFRIAKDRYEERIGTSTDVLNAQSALSTAETNLTQALTDYQSALAEIYAAMGVENVSLSVR